MKTYKPFVGAFRTRRGEPAIPDLSKLDFDPPYAVSDGKGSFIHTNFEMWTRDASKAGKIITVDILEALLVWLSYYSGFRALEVVSYP